MLLPAALVRLNVYSDDVPFNNIMEQIRAYQSEGEVNMELDVISLNDEEIRDLMVALNALGYETDFDPDTMVLTTTNE